MGLQQNLNDIQTNLLQAKTAIAQSISNKGVECSADDKLSNFASKIDSISGGGTGGKFVVPDGMKFAYSTVFDPTIFDVSQVTSMSYMFYNCSGLTNLDLSTWNVDNVINMDSMFSNCSALTSLDLSGWNTSKVIYMNSMFSNCSALTSLDLSGWNTSKVIYMNIMFISCNKLSSLDLSSFNTENVTDMRGLFQDCMGLTNVNLSSFNTENVNDMSGMFYQNINLKNIDLSNFSLKSCTKMDHMFRFHTTLSNLKLPDLGHNENCTSLDLSFSSKLTKDSILYLFNNAFDRASAGYTKAFTITLNAATKALLSDDEIAIATNKGFTVV